ncbi:MAG: 16S rRNA (cytosine(1402)-N(4))-methyltransferase RsmH [Neisseriaceae bacterium]|nr:MAG: 16S rRNA (cytosine(1402)-N(4))-methyltransferase RsmH [Neisseriaceae bacterium]
MEHTTVLLNEAVSALDIKTDGVYVDATFGRGGHSRKILEHLGQEGILVVFDKDPEAIKIAEQLALDDKRVLVVHSGFKNLVYELQRLNIKKINGILFDFGLSTPQLDQAERGFSFRFEAPLDMRMDNSQGITAKEWLNQVSEQELAQVIKVYGEERFYRKVAREIVSYRENKEIETTKELADLISRTIKVRHKGQHPATRTFQAIRIKINQELEEIKIVLPDLLNVLDSGGRLVSIAFHSLEDRIIKQFIKKNSSPEYHPKWVMIKDNGRQEMPLRIVGKPIKPSNEEVSHNYRSRSAIMRVAVHAGGVSDD